MVKSVHIKNFKSIVDLSLDLGTFNVFIGENGCGKSNILEAVTFGAAASADKLDFEFLGSRGIRVTEPEYMFSAFENGEAVKKIEVGFEVEDPLINTLNFNISNNSDKWLSSSIKASNNQIAKELSNILLQKNSEERKIKLRKLFKNNRENIISIEKIVETLKLSEEQKNKQINVNFISKLLLNQYAIKSISNFISYSPEESSLRKFEDTTQIYPLGIKGEGLFQYLKKVSRNKEQNHLIEEISENLKFLDWYDGFDLPKDLMRTEYRLKIKDKYLSPNLDFFDQRSTNEGFLYLLFYSTLFISKDTPTFFGIDNIDVSFNPKLCTQLTRNLAGLAKKQSKQVMLTTHNPAILDGLNLKDDNQRLFVVRRNMEGHTKVRRINFEPKRKKKLSEIWTSGFIGGLPENF